MPKCKIFLCLVQFLLLLLALVPLACALGTEIPLADRSTPCPPPTTGMSSAAAPSIQDVWMQHGGARLYYSALYSARQQYTGGATRIDPACSPLLPPMRAWGTPAPKVKKSYKARRSASKPVAKKPATPPCPDVDKAVEAARAETRAQVEAEMKAAKTHAAAPAGTAPTNSPKKEGAAVVKNVRPH
ncbi:MAG: hypothetical protein RRY29_06165 [Desulfovibrionaceae bacterium]